MVYPICIIVLPTGRLNMLCNAQSSFLISLPFMQYVDVFRNSPAGILPSCIPGVECPFCRACAKSSFSRVASWTSRSAFCPTDSSCEESAVSPRMMIFLPGLGGPNTSSGLTCEQVQSKGTCIKHTVRNERKHQIQGFPNQSIKNVSKYFFKCSIYMDIGFLKEDMRLTTTPCRKN